MTEQQELKMYRCLFRGGRYDRMVQIARTLIENRLECSRLVFNVHRIRTAHRIKSKLLQNGTLD